MAPVLLRAGLTSEDIQDRNRRLDASSQVRLLELAATAAQDDCFGFRLAQNFDLGEIGLLYYVMASSEQIGDALRNAERYCAINNEGVRLRVLLEPSVVIRFEYLDIDRIADRHHIEFWLTTLLRICRTLTGSRIAPQQVTLKHFRSQTPADVLAYLGCKIDFTATGDQIVFPASIGSSRIVGADAHLNRLLLRYADDALDGRVSRRASMRSRVEDQIAHLLPHGKANVAEVARRLGMSRRTLARALSDEDTAFSSVLGEFRRALAQRYLCERDLPISEVAWLLGYSEVSSFTHAFARWTRSTPTAFRNLRDVR
ncbi:AraC family transcriptional regulator ligand-binding domain-containing protein [Bradyrhizobium sp. UFLA05-109]